MVRTSATRLMSRAFKMLMNSSIGRVECPMVKIVMSAAGPFTCTYLSNPLSSLLSRGAGVYLSFIFNFSLKKWKYKRAASVFVDRRSETSERQPVSIILSVEPQWMGVKKLQWEKSMTYAWAGVCISFSSLPNMLRRVRVRKGGAGFQGRRRPFLRPLSKQERRGRPGKDG